MITRQEQLDGLLAVLRSLEPRCPWAIVSTPSDVVALRGRADDTEVVFADGDYDVWEGGGLTRPNVSFAEAVAALEGRAA